MNRRSGGLRCSLTEPSPSLCVVGCLWLMMNANSCTYGSRALVIPSPSSFRAHPSVHLSAPWRSTFRLCDNASLQFMRLRAGRQPRALCDLPQGWADISMPGMYHAHRPVGELLRPVLAQLDRQLPRGGPKLACGRLPRRHQGERPGQRRSSPRTPPGTPRISDNPAG